MQKSIGEILSREDAVKCKFPASYDIMIAVNWDNIDNLGSIRNDGQI